MRHLISILLLLILIWLPVVSFPSSEKSGEGESPQTVEDWKWVGIPFVFANSDYGIIYGVGVGAARGTDRYFSTSISYSAGGNFGAGIVGEFKFGDWRVMRSINFYQKKRFIFRESGAASDTMARAKVNEGEALLSVLHSLGKNFELGPDLQISFSDGRDPKGLNQETLPADSLERFRRGSLSLIGLRARWKTTSSIRPMNGLLGETAVRVGRADGEMYASPRFDLASEVKISAAKSLLPHTRIYCRGWGQYQLHAATPVRNDLGGEQTLRGEPEQRDFGRQLLLGRTQLHWLVFSGITFPSRWLNQIFSFFPLWAIDIESVLFYDCGAAGDPDYPSWRRTRHGFGTGLRFILPPELVFHVDFAWTPYGGKAFYFGAGETL